MRAPPFFPQRMFLPLGQPLGQVLDSRAELESRCATFMESSGGERQVTR